MSYGTSLGITLPTVSVTVGPDYATDINSAIQSLINVIETKVTPAGFNITTDLNFKPGATNYAALNLERMSLENKGAVIDAGTYPVALYAASGELYFNDNAGNQVQISNGGALDVSSLGVITGSGYGSGGVTIEWDAINGEYEFRDSASTYTNIHFDDVVHGNRVLCVSALAGGVMAGSFHHPDSYWTPASGGDRHSIPLPLRQGDRILSIVFTIYGGTSGTKTVELQTKDLTDGTLNTESSTTDTSNAAVTQVTISGINYTVEADHACLARMTSSASSDRYYGVKVTYDRP